jgi:hypothetical protein
MAKRAQPESLIPVERIERSILLLRDQKVILDRDLADLYGVETKVLNQAVSRNISRFPDDFMFQLDWEETEQLSGSQTVTLKRGKNVKYRPRAFTEHGVAMLSSVLRSDRAIEVNIAIMRAFVRLRLGRRDARGQRLPQRQPVVSRAFCLPGSGGALPRTPVTVQ